MFTRLNLPYLASWILIKNTAVPSKLKEKRVLYLSKPIFNEDVKALIDFGKNFSYIRFPRIMLSAIVCEFIEDFNNLDDASYHVNIMKNSKGAIKARNFLAKVMSHYNEHINYDLVLSGNFVYTQLQEFFLVMKSLNKPVAILYKEGMFPLHRHDEMIELFYTTKVFRADKLLLYNEPIRETLVKSNIKGLEQKSTTVVGIPRFDQYSRLKIEDGRKHIALFSFEPNVKAYYLLKDKSYYTKFVEMSYEFHKQIIDYCKNSKDYRLTIKIKSTPSHANYIDQYKKEIIGFDSQIKVTSTIPATELIRTSKYICGYSSTTLIEALICNRILICPNFKSIMKNDADDLLHPFEHLANYVSNIIQLEEVIKNPKKNELNQVNDYLSRMIFKNDGLSTQRVEEQLLAMK